MAQYERVNHSEILPFPLFKMCTPSTGVVLAFMSNVCLPAMRKQRKDLCELLRVEGVIDNT